MNRDFKGIWISKEIWLRKDLNALDKIILAEIDSLDNENHCIAGNEYFAEFCQCSESKITKTIKKLIELNLVEQIHFDGRHRKLRVVKNTIEHSKIYEAESEKIRPNNTSNNSNSKNKLFNSKELNNSQNRPFLDLYNSTELPKVRKLTPKREKGIVNILSKFTQEEILQAFDNIKNSDFLNGKNDRGWKADLDFILREDKFVAVLEGKYNNNKNYSERSYRIFGESPEVKSEHYSKQELAEIERKNKEREANGQTTKF